MVHVVKLLAPEALASAVIGKGGAVIAEIRKSTQAKITLTEQKDTYPGTDCRVLTAQANSEEALTEVTSRIIAKLAECVSSGGPVAEPLGTPGELKIRALAPRTCVGGLIGKGGTSIKQLRESTGAKISVGEAAGTSPSSEQMVTAVGTQQALEQIMTEVCRQISAKSEEGWFLDWVATPGTGAGAGGGRGSAQSYTGAAQGYGPAAAYGPGPGAAFGGPGPGAVAAPPGVDMMMRVAQSLPPYVMQDSRGFALSCVVPNRLVGGLIGRGGSGTKEVQTMTNTKIGIREIPGDPENRSMNIAGPLASTCAAYMLMMKRYLDAEAQASTLPERPGGGGGGGDRRRGAAAAQGQQQAPAAS